MNKKTLPHRRSHDFMTRQFAWIEKLSGLAIGRHLVLVGLLPPYQPDRETDVLLASYPRSGNTWIRAVLASAARGRPVTSLTELDYHIPDRHASVPEVLLSQPRNRGRIVKTHHAASKELQGIRSIFIVRNPVAVALSAHNYRVHATGESRPLPQFFRDFLNGRDGWHCWAEHTKGWLARLDDPHGGCLGLFRYEDLVAHPRAELQRLLDLVPFDLECRNPTKLMEWNSVDAMKKAEAAGNRGHRAGWFVGGSNRIAAALDDECWRAVERFHDAHPELLARLRYSIHDSRKQFQVES